MDNTEIKDTEVSEVKDTVTETPEVPVVEEPSAEYIKEREDLYNEAMEVLRKLGLKWTFRSIEYLVNREDITLNQLRSCVFRNIKGEIKYDIEKAVKYIITAGLIDPKTITPESFEEKMESAIDMMDEWREGYGFVGTMQILLINIMEKKHFFMDTPGVKILEYLASKNLQKDLVMNAIAVDTQTKISQSQAMQS